MYISWYTFVGNVFAGNQVGIGSIKHFMEPIKGTTIKVIKVIWYDKFKGNTSSIR